MGKFTDLQDAIFSVFGAQAWSILNIKTVPSNFVPKDLENEYIRVNIIPSGPSINTKSVSGILIIDIFTAAGTGPNRTSFIADTLDSFLSCKNFLLREGVSLQLQKSSLDFAGNDSSNTTLFRAKYTIPFNFFGVE
jgi:hypothetical protein